MNQQTGAERRGRGARAAAAATIALVLVAGACSSGSDTATGGAAPATTAAPTGTSAPTTSGTSATSDAPAGRPVPGAEWDTADPASVGLDAAKLDELSAQAEAGGSNCLVVVREGKIVEEDYYSGTDAATPQEVWSATKSYSSTLVGIAQDEGLLSVDDLATDSIVEWAGTPSADITVRNLLANDSGRHWDYETDYLKMAGGAADKTQFAIDLGQDAPPGTTWEYNNSAIQTLDRVLTKATGTSPAEFAQEKLLGPIGMADSTMTKDATGNTLTFMGLQSTCRDMARFGVLMLNRGNWGGDQIVSEAWVDDATGQASQPLNGSYGYLWWLNRPGVGAGGDQATTGSAPGDAQAGQMVAGAPDDVFWALGLGGQIIAIHPTSGTVAVRLAPTKPREGASAFGAGTLSLGVEAAVVAP